MEPPHDSAKRPVTAGELDETRLAQPPAATPPQSKHETIAGGSSMLVSGSPAAQGASAGLTSARQSGLERPGALIGRYKLLQQIGEGGFGVVFMAEQAEPVVRKVALKIIKLGMDTRQVVARFEQERQALAMMDHPHIARVLDAGATDAGRPFFVMELCKGDSITDYCDKNNLSIRERLQLFTQVCAAVQHAHTKGIIHRDLKPTNVLVSTTDGKPSAKVIDFGVAKATASKLTEKTLFTEHRQFIGTPQYMSPEQAEGSLDIDTRTDVYSLGVLLYELITGTTPFSAKDLRSAADGDIQRIIREVDPPRPSTRLTQNSDTLAGVAARRQIEPRKLGLIVRGELDWIVMKALEKVRQRRYETADAFALDLQRYLAGEAVLAAPPSTAYRLQKFIRRHRGAVAAGIAVAAALLVGVVGFAWQADAARRQRDRAVAAEAQAEARAAELTQVAEFQARILQQVDAAAAGEGLMAGIRSRLAAALESDGLPEPERTARTQAFNDDLARVNATDTAVELIDRTILKPAVEAVERDFVAQPLIEGRLRRTLGNVYSALGQYERALELHRATLEICRRELGSSHDETLRSLADVGTLASNAGQLDEAERCYREAYEARRARGDMTRGWLVALNNLGNFYREMDRLPEAEPLLREAVEGGRRVLGNEDRDTLISLNTLGQLLVVQGRSAEAEPLWREAYESGRRAFGPDDPDVLVWTANLGGLLQTMQRYADAEPLVHEALQSFRRVLGEDHPNTISATRTYGGLMARLERFDEAEHHYRAAMERSEQTRGPNHPDTLYMKFMMAAFLEERGRLADAEPLARAALEGRRELFGTQHSDTLAAAAMMARLIASQGRLHEARAICTETLQTCREKLGDDHPDTLMMLMNFGNMLRLHEQFQEAEPLLRAAAEARLRVSGPDHQETLVAQSNWAMVLADLDRLPESEALHREVLSRMRRVLGDQHTRTLNEIAACAALERSLGRPAEAEALSREAIAGMMTKMGKNHARTGNARSGLGQALFDQGRYAEAEQEHLEAHRILTATSELSPVRRRTGLTRLIHLYEAWHKAEPGKGYDAKAAEWRARLNEQPASAPGDARIGGRRAASPFEALQRN